MRPKPPPGQPAETAVGGVSRHRPVRQRSKNIVIETNGGNGECKRSVGTLSTPTRPTALEQMRLRNNNSRNAGGFGRGTPRLSRRRKPPHHVDPLMVDISNIPHTPGTPASGSTTTNGSSYRTPTPTTMRRQRLPAIG
jgi:hypothetical protein